MLKSLVVLIFITASLPGFGQGGTEMAPLSEGGGKVIIQGAPPAPKAPEDPTETSPQDPNQPAGIPISDDEADLRELEAAQAKRMEKMKKIQESMEGKKKAEDEAKLGPEGLDLKKLTDEKTLTMIQEQLRTGLFSKVPREETVEMIKEKIKGTGWEKLVSAAPSTLEVFVDVLRSPEAMPELIEMLKRKEDLKLYGYIWIGIFIAGLFLKRRLVKPKWPFLKRRLVSLMISLPLGVLTLGLFYSMFQTELAPTVDIILKRVF